MNGELRAGEAAVCPSPMSRDVCSNGTTEGRRPNLSGDLPTVLQPAPMFRRAALGYDRFQVETYVQWAEDELATADRERERLMARYLDQQATLQESRELLSHSSGGGDFLQASRRIGS